jgi:universal stress protein A
MFDPIVVAVDASPASRAAASLAIWLARAESAKIWFINVVDVARLMPLAGSDAPYPEDAIAMVDEESRRMLEEVKARAVAAGVDASICSTQGDAADEILNAAGERNAGLIVMGTHGRIGVARLFIGSVADAVLRRSSCPVLVTKEPQHA